MAFKLQAIVVGFLASFMACITEYILDGQVTLDNLLILIASSVTSAAVSSTVLGLKMKIAYLEND